MEKLTKHSIQWFYNLLAKGECETLDFKEQLEDKSVFGKAVKWFAPKYEDLAKVSDAFANELILIYNTLTWFSFAGSFAEVQTSASGTNAFCLHFSLQVKSILQTFCKETAPNFQSLIKISFANPLAENLNLLTT
jgi:hypothetical protein